MGGGGGIGSRLLFRYLNSLFVQSPPTVLLVASRPKICQEITFMKHQELYPIFIIVSFFA